MVSPLLDQSKSKLVWETITSPRAIKLRVQWTAKLTSRESWKTNKKPLKSCQKSKYQYDTTTLVAAAANIFGEQTRLASSRRSNFSGAARNMAQVKREEARRGKTRELV